MAGFGSGISWLERATWAQSGRQIREGKNDSSIASRYRSPLDKRMHKAYLSGWRGDTLLVGCALALSQICQGARNGVGSPRTMPRPHAPRLRSRPGLAASSKSSSSNLVFFCFPLRRTEHSPTRWRACAAADWGWDRGYRAASRTRPQSLWKPIFLSAGAISGLDMNSRQIRPVRQFSIITTAGAWFSPI